MSQYLTADKFFESFDAQPSAQPTNADYSAALTLAKSSKTPVLKDIYDTILSRVAISLQMKKQSTHSMATALGATSTQWARLAMLLKHTDKEKTRERARQSKASGVNSCFLARGRSWMGRCCSRHCHRYYR